jgi:hypothetical protein
MNELRKNLFFPIVVSVFGLIIGSAITFWINNQYYQPHLVWEARACSNFEQDCYYYKLGSLSVGNIYIVNNGHKPDTNISIIINGKINQSDVSVVDLTSSYEIKNLDKNKTLINIESLKPNEDADITFRTEDDSDVYSINQIYSDSGRLKSFLADLQWWQFSLSQIIFIIIFSILSGVLGYLSVQWHFRKRILE